MVILEIQLEDFGLWKCNITLQNGQKFTKHEHLKQDDVEKKENDSATEKGAIDNTDEHHKDTVTEYTYSEYFK